MGKAHERTLLFLILLWIYTLLPAHSFAQVLPEEYQLLSEYLKSRDEKIGRSILRNYPDAVFIQDLKLMLSEDAYKRGDFEGAKNYLESIDVNRLKPDLLSKYADLWRVLNLDKKKALLANPVLFRDFIGSVELSLQEAISLAEKLTKGGYYQDVLKVLSGIKDKRACYYLGVAYLRTGDEDKAKEALSSCDDKRGYSYLISIYLREDREDQIRDTLLKVRDDHLRDQLLFLVGRHYLYARNYDKAKDYFSLMTDTYQKFFNLGLLNFIKRNYQDAIQHFIRSYYFASSESEISQACFWTYRSYVAQGREDVGLRYLIEATKGDGFYSAVAKLQVGEPVAYRGLRRVFSEGDMPIQANIIKAIRDGGFYYYSRLEAFKRLPFMSPADIIAISKFDPFLSIRLAVRKYGSRSEVYNSVAFPMPYKEYVYKASERYGLDASLIWAVMRQESLFDVFAVSRSGAKGLMQLIENTARWMSQKAGVPLQDVFSPETNILLGSAYLRYLYDMWEGDLIKVLASYNAGENRVKYWSMQDDPYVFIETIPFKETREYVKRVLYNYYIYSELLK
ncbi:Lytic transglycosylase catalytic [Hydrogenobacter thermophilus TK-6]|uniref:Lytic transglycosylase catalytic n=1 Tax=Hydrogenobacter thermophilus (strain DSM 6534 / IAM 12695 / TK-6) TaxID=608538 RepID=D3DI04_HYDTT|nr:lytic transglycosylase domain-containing protein [Hydrogenobacter thermophilus]ADO45389.1 Lytic transglycosylase catalytic [Hydrogenobacter thermophilus TK-6]BAI69456.1 lytic transglycosylase catalytic precursor [Hydrogenobacter thermophilus TK-6]